MVIPRVVALKLWDIQIGGITIVINGRRVPRKPRSLLRNKTEANVDEKASALIAAIDYGAGKLYYLDLRSNDSNKLRQALMMMDPRGEEKSEIWFELVVSKFHKMIETQDNAKVGVLRSDNGGEYQSSIFKSIWKDMTSFIKLLVPIHPSKMESLNEKSALQNTDILLGRSNHICVYLINRVPSSSINFQTPLQALINVELPQPSQIYLLVFMVAWHLCIYTSTNALS
ncbi:hypothetical protein AAG906_009478 [Vitis piasezkii]